MEKSKLKNNENKLASCDFSSIGLHPALCKQLKDKMGFEAPTLTQAQAIPAILSGRHVLVNATDRGKTVTYLAPIIHQLQKCYPKIQGSDGTFALVIVPTNELCLQVYENLSMLSHCFPWIVPGYIMAGRNRFRKEKSSLRKGISILVATPGRLLEHLKHHKSYFVHKNLRWIVFDETDRILQLGFDKEIEEILDILGSRPDMSKRKDTKSVKQILLFSATLNEKVNRLVNVSLDNPIMIGLDKEKIQQSSKKQVTSLDNAVEKLEDSLRLSITSKGGYELLPQLNQRYVTVPCGSRLVVLLSVLNNLFTREPSQKVVVFFSTCDCVNFHHALITQFYGLSNLQTDSETRELFVKFNVFKLHGKMTHEDRLRSFNAFKTEKSALLLCIDVCLTRFDFPKVRSVIQYDPPGLATEYVNRVVSAAQLGARVDIYLFLQPTEVDYLEELKKRGVKLSEYSLSHLLDGFAPNHHGKTFVSVKKHPWVRSLQKSLESFVCTEGGMEILAEKASCSWVGAYGSHPEELKKIFMVQKLDSGHVMKSFALNEQPSTVDRSVSVQKNHTEKRKKQQQHEPPRKKYRMMRYE